MKKLWKPKLVKHIEPPLHKYELTVTVRGNTHAELVSELGYVVRGGFYLATDKYRRDECKSYGGKSTITLIHTNPTQTTEQYDLELEKWFNNPKES